MKRRMFLSMVGATAAAPALAAMPQAALPAKLKAAGLAHAQKYPMVSVLGLHRRMGIPKDQAQQVLTYLIDKGIIGKPGPIFGTGLTSATSKVFEPVPHRVEFARKALKKLSTRKADKIDWHKDQNSVSSDWLTHLRVLAASNGFSLSPRALGAMA